jgi:hypothetical protein
MGGAPLASPTFTGTVSGITATMVGLGNVTNNAQTQAAIVPNTAPSAGQDLVGNAGGTAYAAVTMSGDCTRSSTGAITCTKSNGTAFGTGAFATIANFAPLASPTFTGTVTIPTGALISGFAPLASPTFTGTATAPTFSGSLTGHASLDAPLASPAFTGTVSGITATMVGLGNVTNNAQTQAAIVPNTAPSAGQDLVGNAGGTAYAPVTMSGDCTRSSTGAITCTKSNGTALGTGAFATISNYLTTASAASTYAPIFTLTTTGTSGAATYSSNTLNIPQYAGGGSMTWPTFTGLTKYGGSSNWLTPTYADVTALFGSGSCSGYLKSDGTCPGSVQVAANLASSGSTGVTGQLPIGQVGSAGLSASNGVGIASTGAITLTYGTTANTVAQGNDSRITGAVQSGGALGTPSSGVITNLTGTCTSCTANSATSVPAANVASGALANGMTATTQSAGDNSTKLATTAYVATAVTYPVANTTFTTSTGSVGANTCNSTVQVAMTGVTTSMTFLITASADTSAATGWGSTGGLVLDVWPTAGYANYKICNQTAASITPTAVTFNIGAR